MSCKRQPIMGDIVHVRMRVHNVRLDGAAIDILPLHYANSPPVTCMPPDIVKIEERPLKVGDKVRIPMSSHIWQIVAAHCSTLFVEKGGSYAIVKVGDAERADD